MYQEIETQIKKKEKPIRLEKTLKKRKESLEEFIEKFFIKFNEDRNTIYVNTKEVQTGTGKRRSLGDIFMICNYYYPNCTLKEIVEILYKFCATKKGFRTSSCNQIKKRVFYYNEELPMAILNKTNPDEYGKTVDFWDITQPPLDQIDNEDDQF